MELLAMSAEIYLRTKFQILKGFRKNIGVRIDLGL